MKLRLDIRSGKGNKSSEADTNETVVESSIIVGFLEKKGWVAKKCNCYPDGTETLLEK